MKLYLFAAMLVVNILINVAGTIALKYAATSNSAIHAVVGCACYVVGAGLYLLLLRGHSLSIMAVVTSSLGLVTLIVVGLIFFDEEISTMQWVGVALALLAVALISLPSSG